MKHSNEQVNTRKETHATPTESINSNIQHTTISVQYNNQGWRKSTTLILKDPTISKLIEKKMSRGTKIKVRYFSGAKIKHMYH